MAGRPRVQRVHVASPGPASSIVAALGFATNAPGRIKTGSDKPQSLSAFEIGRYGPQEGCCRATTRPDSRRTSLPPQHTHPLICAINAVLG